MMKTSALRDELDFFVSHQDIFYQLFPDRYVAIRNHQVVALGDTLLDVVRAAEAKGHPRGTYQAQLCGKDASCYTLNIHPLMISAYGSPAERED